eukprot:TRINITY_DN31242_c0_g1_i4.p1 TRINITY_DN31242_c0_g1~~TRINITY_DN31242_c0_g1_i4.p1  ORF type:complete len:434 (+),score=32.33 TRINITY_DN31242_c0_g1_i4:54-1355(+)
MSQALRSMVSTAEAMCVTYASTAKLFWAWWTSDWRSHSSLTKQLERLFEPIDVAANLVLNILMLNAVHLILICAADFSRDFVRFSICFLVTPSLLGSFAYIHYRYGSRTWTAVPRAWRGWLRNWMLVNAIACVCWTQQLLLYLLLLRVETFLPLTLQGAISFPTHVFEQAFRHAALVSAFTTVVLGMALPVWTYAYKLNMGLIGRKADMGSLEALLEIVYTGSTSMTASQIVVPISVLLVQAGFRFHIIHILAGAVEIAFINRVANYKFAVIHKLEHDIKALYQMTHIEHHICKGIYPNTSGAGVWENWIMGGSFTCGLLALASLPYMHFAVVGIAGNVLVHTMWPWKSWAQWHTLHHIVGSDVYSVNIPSDNDRQFSRDVARYDEQLRRVSIFVRMPCLTDVLGSFLFVAFMVGTHFGFGIGLFASWHEAQW